MKFGGTAACLLSAAGLLLLLCCLFCANTASAATTGVTGSSPHLLPSSHPQHMFCNAHFVVAAKVKREMRPKKVGPIRWFEKSYKIMVKRIFKRTEKFDRADQTRIWTKPDGNSCAVKLQPRRKYVIAGEVMGGKLYMTACGDSWVQPWSSVTRKQRKGLRRLYQQGCDCKIELCPWYGTGSCGGGGGKSRSASKCYWTSRGAPHDCQLAHSVCIRHPNGKCDWTRSRQYKSCLNNHIYMQSKSSFTHHSLAFR